MITMTIIMMTMMFMMTTMMTMMMAMTISHLSRLLGHDLDLLLIATAGDGADDYFDQGLHSLERRGG